MSSEGEWTTAPSRKKKQEAPKAPTNATRPAKPAVMPLSQFIRDYKLDHGAAKDLERCAPSARDAVLASDLRGVKNPSGWVIHTLGFMKSLGGPPRYDDAELEELVRRHKLQPSTAWMLRSAARETRSMIKACNLDGLKNADAWIVSALKADWENGAKAAPAPPPAPPPPPHDRAAALREAPEHLGSAPAAPPVARAPPPPIAPPPVHARALGLRDAPEPAPGPLPAAPAGFSSFAAPPPAAPAGFSSFAAPPPAAPAGFSAFSAPPPAGFSAFSPPPRAPPKRPDESPLDRLASFLAGLGMARYLIALADEEIHCIEDMAFLELQDYVDVGIPAADAARLRSAVAQAV